MRSHQGLCVVQIGILGLNCGCKVTAFFRITKFFETFLIIITRKALFDRIIFVPLHFMRTYILFILFSLLPWTTVWAQNDGIKGLFLSMPSSLMPMLGENSRMDLIDFYESKMRPTITNEWGEYSQILNLTPNYMLLQEDSKGVVQTAICAIKPQKADTIICVVRTIKAPQADSEIAFYDTQWKKVDTDRYFSLPSVKDLVKDPNDIPTVTCTEIEFLPQSTSNHKIKVTFDLTEGRTDAKPELKPTIEYQWNGNKFVRL